MEINRQEFKVAEKITLQDMQQAMGNKVSKDLLKNIFIQVAQGDDTITGTELETFMEKLEQAAGEGNILDDKELKVLYKSMGHGASTLQAFKIFVETLLEVNDKKIKDEQMKVLLSQKDTDKYYNNGKLEKEVETDVYGNVVETLYNSKGGVKKKTEKDKNGNVLAETTYDAKGNITREIKKDTNGNIVSDFTYDLKGNITEHIHNPEDKDLVEEFVTRNQDGEVIVSGTVNRRGKKTEYHFSGADLTKRVEVYNDSYRYENYYNDVGGVAKQISIDAQGNVKSTTTYSYNPDGSIKEVEKDGNYSYERTYNSDRNKTKEVVKDADGNVVEITEYSYDKENNEKSMVIKDANGNVLRSEEYTWKGYEKIKTVYKDENGNVEKTKEVFENRMLVTFSNGNTLEQFKDESTWQIIKEVSKDKDGNITHVVEYNNESDRVKETTYKEQETIETTYGKNSDNTVYKDLEGNVIKSIQEIKDAEGRVIKKVVRDADDNILETTDITYSRNNKQEVVRNSLGVIVEENSYSVEGKNHINISKKYDEQGQLTSVDKYKMTRRDGKLVAEDRQESYHNGKLDRVSYQTDNNGKFESGVDYTKPTLVNETPDKLPKPEMILPKE